MTAHPIDLDYLRSCKSVGPGTIRRVADEIERLRAERDGLQARLNAVLALHPISDSRSVACPTCKSGVTYSGVPLACPTVRAATGDA